jgi:hypothetical protein
MCRLAAWLCWATSSKSHPVSGFPLYQIVLDPATRRRPTLKARRKNAGRADIKGADLFHLFEKYELTEQMRASEDTQHTVFIERMRAAGRQPFIDQEVIERLSLPRNFWPYNFEWPASWELVVETMGAHQV